MSGITNSMNKIIREWNDPAYLSKKAGGFSEVPQRTMQSWIEKDLLIPASNTRGTGTKRGFSFINCVEIGIIKRLTVVRLSLVFIHMIMAFLRGSRDIKALDKRFKKKPITIPGPGIVSALLVKKSYIVVSLGVLEILPDRPVFLDDVDTNEDILANMALAIIDNRFEGSMDDELVSSGIIKFVNDPKTWMELTVPESIKGDTYGTINSIDKTIIIDVKIIAERVARRMRRDDLLDFEL